MLKMNRKSIWYGKLATPNASHTVIFDPDFPTPPKGKLYLYNVERDKVIQYVEDIVAPKLHDMDESEAIALQKAIDGRWQITKKEFIATQAPMSSGSYGAPKATTNRAKKDEDYDDYNDAYGASGDDVDFDLDSMDD